MLRPILLSGLILLAGAGCAETTDPGDASGTLRVTTYTSGAHPDADGFTLTVSGQGTVPMGLIDTVTYTLPINDYTVTLGDIEGSCSVADGNPRTPYVPVGTTTVQFFITCP